MIELRPDEIASALMDLHPPARDGTEPRRAWLNPLRGEDAHRWLTRVGDQLELDVREVDATYGELPELLQRGAPFIVPVDAAESRFLLVVARRRGQFLVRRADGTDARMSSDELTARLTENVAPVRSNVRNIAEKLGIRPKRLSGTVEAYLLASAASDMRVGRVWLLRRRGEVQRAMRRRMGYAASTFLILRIVCLAAAAARWGSLGAMIDSPAFSRGLWLLWLAFYVTEGLCDVWSGRQQFHLARVAGVLLRNSLLRAVLRSPEDVVRKRSQIELLVGSLEVDGTEISVLRGLCRVCVGLLELFVVVVLVRSNAAMLAWLAIGAVLLVLFFRTYVRHMNQWCERRVGLTTSLITSISGHQTRVVQQDPASWHEREVRELDTYIRESERLDRTLLVASSLPGGLLLLGVVALGVAVAFFGHAGDTLLMVAALLAAHSGFSEVSTGMQGVGIGNAAWQRVQELLRRGFAGVMSLRSAPLSLPADGALSLHNVHASVGGRPVLENVNLRIGVGDRVVVEGISGGGKSTLVRVISGMSRPQRGLVFLGSGELGTVDEREWRRNVILCPQFQENHVFAETLAFNLLMSRRWPPTPEDLAEARRVCDELGLGELVDKMPNGLHERVGESGWQLSHGEKSRLFVARGILSGAKVTIFDESLGSLDPVNAEMTLSAILANCETVILVAHP